MVRADRVHHFTATGTSVELDAASQVEATSAMASRGQIAVGWYEIVGNGWPQHTLFLKTCGQRQQTTHSHAYPIHSRFTPRYHSHPVFEARPSQKDNENQRNYQALCHDASTGLAPWVGVIISPYLPSLPSPVGVLVLIGGVAGGSVSACISTCRKCHLSIHEQTGVAAPDVGGATHGGGPGALYRPIQELAHCRRARRGAAHAAGDAKVRQWVMIEGVGVADCWVHLLDSSSRPPPRSAMEAQGGDPCRVDLASPWHEAADCSEPDGTGWTKLRKLQVWCAAK